jgi:hypothetical protein
MPDTTIKSMYYDYELYVGGKKLDSYRKSLIQDISLEDNASGSDLLTLTVADPDFLFIDDNIFVEDTPVKFLGGWVGEVLEFNGYIALIDVDFPPTGFPNLTIHCMDSTHLMNRKPKKRTWNNMKDSDVAKAIFKEYGLIPVVDDTGKVQETISQSNATDIQFLMDKAKNQPDDEFLCYVEGKYGYFVKKKLLAKAQDTLEYRKGSGRLLSFRPRIDKETKQEEIDQSNIGLDGKEQTDKATNKDNRDLQGSDTTTYKYTGNHQWTKQTK